VKRGLLDSKGEPVSKRTFSCAEGEVVDLPPCPTSGIFHNCFGTRTYSDGEYVGEWKDNKAHGQGTVATANGDKYIGEFKDNKMHGQGTYKYVGECKNNESHGHDAYADLDGKMEVDIKRSIDKQQQFEHEHVNVTIYNGVVLLTGEVPDPRWTDTIIDLAKSHERSRQVINRLELAGKTNMMSRLNDHRITARVKTAIATSAPAELSCIKVVTEKANVYLMGLVTPEEADIAVEATRRVTGVVRIIKVFEYL